MKRTIGVFDSGLGGLSVLRAIRSTLPTADLIYCADHEWLPYGERSPEIVRERSIDITRALVEAGADAVVIACNTATAAAADRLRATFDVPIVGMEPAVKPATAATRTGVVGVLGTGGTLASTRFAGLLDRFAGDVRVVTRPAPELVVAVEQDAPRACVAAAVRPLLDAGADVIVLGCTHFPFLRTEIEAAAGPGVRLIDTGPAVARELVRRIASSENRGGVAPVAARTLFWTTGDPTGAQPAMERLWGEPLVVTAAPLTVPAADAGGRGHVRP